MCQTWWQNRKQAFSSWLSTKLWAEVRHVLCLSYLHPLCNVTLQLFPWCSAVYSPALELVLVCDLIWPIEYGRSDSINSEPKPQKAPLSFSLTLRTSPASLTGGGKTMRSRESQPQFPTQEPRHATESANIAKLPNWPAAELRCMNEPYEDQSCPVDHGLMRDNKWLLY